MQKNPIPYYTLKQASKILNAKFKTDVYNSKMILSMSLHYKIDLHVLFFGDWSVSCDCHVPIALTREENENRLIYQAIISDIEDIVEGSIFDLALLRLNNFALTKISTFGKFDINPDNDYRGIDGFLRLEHLFQEDGFNSISNILLKYRFNSVSKLSDDEINSIEILAIYPTIKESFDFKPKAKPYGNEDQGDSYPHIKIKDLLITHVQLEKIINGDLKSRFISNKELNEESVFHLGSNHRRGVSVAKKNAKLAAETLANYLWAKDAGKNIKLLEMARIVHAELQITEHKNQLTSIEAVKEWLRPVAPNYAKLAGRPQQTID